MKPVDLKKWSGSRTASRVVEASKRTGEAARDSTARTASRVVEASKRTGEAVRDSTARTTNRVVEASKRTGEAARDGTARTASRVVEASKRTGEAARDSTTKLAKSARERTADLSNLSQGALASALSIDLNSALASLANGPATIYDKAMDARYLATSIGGGNHRLFDGGHTLSGAFEAARNASADDSIVQEALGYMQGLFRDVTTPKGLPLANWDKATYDQVSGFLKSQFGVPPNWFYDLNSFDAAEVLGATIGVLAAALNWSRADAEQFGRLAGGMGLATVLSANPLLLIVTVVALAKTFIEATAEGRLGNAVDGLARGTVTSGASLGAVALTSLAGGPAGLALLVSLVTGLVACKLVSKVSVADVACTVAGQATRVARAGIDRARTGANDIASTAKPVPPR